MERCSLRAFSAVAELFVEVVAVAAVGIFSTGRATMQDPENPKICPPGDDIDADDDTDDDNIKTTRLNTSGTDATRCKSEQDLARTYSLDLLAVC